MDGLFCSGLEYKDEVGYTKYNRVSERINWVGDMTRYRNPTESEMAMKSLDQHIEITPGICSGKPRIAGHRITVAHIAIWHERMGKCADEIATEYDLTLADVYAALAYYFDHREEIDQSIQESEEFVKAFRQQTFSKLAEKLQEKR